MDDNEKIGARVKRGLRQPSIPTTGSSAFTDPTYNVLQLVNAAVERLDDVQVLYQKLNESDIKRIDELQKIHVSYGEKIAVLNEKINIAESKRIDAIRAIDVAAVATASEKQAQQAVVLATQLTATAETLRSLVAQTQQGNATQIQNMSTQFNDRLQQLEKAQNEARGAGAPPSNMAKELTDLREAVLLNKGKQGVTSPLLMLLVAAISGLIVFIVEKVLGH